MPHPAGTLVDVLDARDSDTLGYTFVTEDGEHRLSFGELGHRARAVGAHLVERGLTNERVLLVYPPGLDYVTAFFACLYAGAVAVPVFPPDPARWERSLPRLVAVAADAEPRAVLTTSDLAALAPALVEQGGLPELPWLATDTVPADAAAHWRRPAIGPDTTALLQYTSGSATSPKGVIVSHANLLYNSGLIQQSFGTTPESRAMSWLPLYHDMGLVGGVLQPLHVGFAMTLASPLSFLADPLRWLETIAQRGITVSGGPNFAYDLCVRRYDPSRCADLDLSRWSVAFNGAEPIRAETLDRFADVFAPHGFRPSAFLPCYGLAEATLIVTGRRAGDGARRHRFDARELARGRAVEVASDAGAGTALVGVGAALGEQRVDVIDADTGRPCPDGTVGEIEVHGPGVARGYWRSEDASAAVFGTGGRTRLRTGDLGFRHDGELFVTGRASDLIIVRGRNLYPQDIEHTAVNAGSDVRPGCVAAFAVPGDEGERVVVVAERSATATGPDTAAVDRVREAVADAHEVGLHEVVLIQAGTSAKTSSGKIRRRATRDRYLAGDLEVRHRTGVASPAGPDADPATWSALPPERRGDRVTRYLLDLVGATRGADPSSVRADQPLDRLGLDSLATVEVCHRIERDLDVRVDPRTFFAPETLGALAANVAERLGTGDRPVSAGVFSAPPVPEGVKALWYLQRLNPESTAYQLVRAFTVTGDVRLDADALERSLRIVVDRHEALRLCYPERDGEPVATQAALPDRLLDVVESPAAEIPDRLAALAGTRFDLEQGPLLRASLLVAPDGPAVLVLAAHHIALDLWSAAIVLDEIRQAYRAVATGDPIDLPAPGDYRAAAGSAVAAADSAESRDFWVRTLSGELPVLALPAPRTALPRPDDATVRSDLPAALRDQVHDLAGRHRTTTYVVLLSAFQVLLHRFCGQADILVGSPAGLRRDVTSARTVGYLLNTVVHRADLSGAPSFDQVLAANRTAVTAALDHQDYPFSQVVRDLSVDRDGATPAVFRAMFAFEQAPGGAAVAAMAIEDPATAIALGGTELTARPLPRDEATTDLVLRIAESGHRLVTVWEFDPDAVDHDTVRRLASTYDWLLAELTGRPQRCVGAAALADPAHAAEIQRGPRDADVPDERLHELILSRAAAHPTAVAVRHGEAELTYGELHSRVTALAAVLREAGIGPEARAAIYLPRSPDAIVAILATLAAGGGYLPLDPSAAPARTRHILDDARPRVLITDTAHAADHTGHAARIVLADRVPAVPSSPGADAERARRPAPENLAYVMYTSGSSGRPKGIEVSHENLLRSTHARLGYFPDRVASFLLISSLGFDSSVAGLFWTLYEGGALVLPDPDRDQDPAHHLELLRRHRVSHFESVPSLYRELLDLLAPDDLPDLRSVVVAGEACPRQVADDHRRLLPGVRLVNEYGPSEASVWCGAHRVDGPVRQAVLPIGRPIAGYLMYVLDGYGHPAPPGTAGEIHVGGAGVTRGYLGAPAATAARFLPDPFAGAPGARMYRTGDRGRVRPDGEIEFLGRVDGQLKIRGVRIEPAEIETALLGHEAVRAAVVRPVDGPGGHQALAAYLVPDQDADRPSTEDLRGYLLTQVPPAMVPAVFVWLAELPLTAHGKIDESALPDSSVAAPGDGRIHAGDPVADLIADVFAALFEVPRVGLDDDFFALGGHSLMVTRLTSRLRALFGVEVAPRTVFTEPTVRRLARVVTDATGAPRTSDVPKARRDDAPPLSHAQQRLWFINELMPGNVAYNVPVAVRLRGPLDRDALNGALTGLVARHESLRTTFEVVGTAPVQRIHPPARVDVPLVEPPWADGSGADPDRLDAELTGHANEPLDLARGPLWTARLIRLTPREHVLSLVLHHTIADGWSLTVIADELATAYPALLAGRPDPVPGPEIQYADFTLWQRDTLTPESMRPQLEYWTRRLTGAPPARLPTDRPRPAVPRLRGARVPWHLDAATTAGVRTLARATDSTVFMVLLGAFGLLVGGRSDSDDVVLGTPVSGRTQVETERLVGFFANTLPLRLDLAGDPTFRDLVQQVRELSLDAFVRQDVPFELLVESVQTGRDLGRNPLFQIIFAWQNAPRPALRLGELELDLIEVETGTAMVDLAASLWEDGDEITGHLEYDRDLFEPETMAEFAAGLTRVLTRAADDAQQPISTLLRAEAPAPPAAGPSGSGRTSPAELFARAAAAHPDAPAVRGHGGPLTYAALAARVGRLTGEIRELGAGPGTAVGLGLDRSADWVAALLAVWASGATAIILDPRRPSWWRERVLDDAGPGVLIENGGPVALNDRAGPRFDDDVAWVGYTAGGLRGATLTAPDLATQAEAIAAALDLTSADRVPSRAPLADHTAIWEVTATVAAGAEILLGDPDGATATVVSDPESTEPAAGPVRNLVSGPRPPAGAAPGTVFVPDPPAPSHSGWFRDDTGRWIGRPLVGAALHVRDRFGHPVEPRIPGELHTAHEATGIRARYLGDGRFEWLGLITDDDLMPDADDVAYVAPRTGVETVLAQIWADLLDGTDIGVLDDFFALGGHSLLATQLIAEVRGVFQVDVPVRTFFEDATIEGLAAAITAREAAPGQAEQIAEIVRDVRANVGAAK